MEVADAADDCGEVESLSDAAHGVACAGVVAQLTGNIDLAALVGGRCGWRAGAASCGADRVGAGGDQYGHRAGAIL
jgi:hypothetical protein